MSTNDCRIVGARQCEWVTCPMLYCIVLYCINELINVTLGPSGFQGHVTKMSQNDLTVRKTSWEKNCLEVAFESWQRWQGNDVLWQIVPCSRSRHWKCKVTNGWQMCSWYDEHGSRRRPQSSSSFDVGNTMKIIREIWRRHIVQTAEA